MNGREHVEVVRTPVGPVSVTVRDGRVRAVRFGGRAGKGKAAAARWLARWFRGEDPGVRLDLSWATPFERRVYAVVRRIPRGGTRTYGEVARAAGAPGAARAVGRVLARNRICLFIPCHRVVGAAGPGGFTAPGGVRLKRRLLSLERRAPRA
ncbi:MAG TPA: methylated-DNA--[protein]-cysteine S-methyltransferase [Planctomycetota bacterium]|nr:methylated-DNA--[protein]-cysteine S-methyltransferase [Planctomycetota bacterium]